MKLSVDISVHICIWLSLRIDERLREISEVIPVPYPAPEDTPSDDKLHALVRERTELWSLHRAVEAALLFIGDAEEAG